ncbi:MAG: hypothetical protein AAGA36_00100 [Pseudomonadota bacterium]
MAYAETTSVSPEKSKAEIEGMLRKAGAKKFMQFWDDEQAVIQFMLNDRMVRFVLPMPDRKDHRFHYTAQNKRRTAKAAEQQYEQGIRQKWRALLLVIKAKLEAIDSGIVTFDEEFMAHIVLPDNKTMGEVFVPQIAQSYEDGGNPPMLPNYSAGS